MADAAAFECVCDELERASSLDRLEARGTVRLALKQAGLEARNVTVEQMRVILEKVLPSELASRGIDRERMICERITTGLESAGLARIIREEVAFLN